MPKKLATTATLWTFVMLLGFLTANCAKPVPGEKEMLGKIKGKASLRLADGSTISRDDSDEYSPYLVKLSDGYLVLIFGSNRGCGGCSDHNIFMAKSLTAFDGQFIPLFNTPVAVQPSGSPMNEGSEISFAAKASGTNVAIFVNYAGLIRTATFDPTNPTSGSLTGITNTNHNTNTIIGISGDGSLLYSTDGTGIGYAFNPTNSTTASAFGYGMDNATSATQVRQENSGYDDAILGVYYSSTYAAAGAQYFGPIVGLDTSLALSGLAISNLSTFSADDPANDIVLFSAFDYFSGFTEDLYVITSHTSGDLWDTAGFPGIDFGGGGGGGYPLRIFATAAQPQGNLGGIAGADNYCNTDTNNPMDGSTYKALLGMTGTRDLSTDWPLMPDNQYLRDDMITPIGMTDQFGEFPDTIMNAFAASVPANSHLGMQDNWVISASSGSANCTGWTTTAGTQYYATPTTADMTGTGFFTGSVNCTTLLTLICVEQPL